MADFFSRWLLNTEEFDKNSEDSDIIYGIDELTSKVIEIRKQEYRTVNRRYKQF